ncbi:hypothetical protein NIES2100_27110 [Calothrix sp. NIES-2100]|nr:hypothetical protein NIES2100_27110 [Calothrix sp. NIES-2100]
MLNPECADQFTIAAMINQSQKLLILVKAYHDSFVQCVSPTHHKTVLHVITKIENLNIDLGLDIAIPTD